LASGWVYRALLKGQRTLQTSTEASDKSKATIVRQRVAIGAILIAAAIALFWADARLSRVAPQTEGPAWMINWQGLALHGGLLTLVAAGLVVAATAETIGMCRSAGMRPAGGWAVPMAVALTIHPWIARNVQGLSADRLAVWLLAIGLAGSVVAIMIRRQTAGAIQDVASTWFAAAYIGFLMSFAVRLRQEVGGAGGAWLVLYFLAAVKFTDIFAYGTGMAFGKHKLIAWLSPGKTVEGLIGGLVGAAIITILLLRGFVIIGIDTVEHPIAPGIYVWAGLIGALLGGIGQVGDLMESLLKRGASQKDSARLLPGFGGVFDLLDSVLLAAPAAWVLLPWALAPLLD